MAPPTLPEPTPMVCINKVPLYVFGTCSAPQQLDTHRHRKQRKCLAEMFIASIARLNIVKYNLSIQTIIRTSEYTFILQVGNILLNTIVLVIELLL